jgi:arylsulfatase A
MRKTWILLAALCAGWLSAAAAEKPAGQKPNIILILSDDVGLGDVGFSGGAFKTPHIDALAKGGTQFEFCYSTPLCGPSRCQLLTGRYPFRTGLINNNSHQAIQPGHELMIPTMLKKAGYVTASVGKWGQLSLGPGEWGFDEYLVFQGSGRYWAEQAPRYRVNGVQKELGDKEYLPDVMHEFIVKFLAAHKEQPFFLYYPMSHIHGPILRTPDSKPGAKKDQLYRDNVEYMDKLVGKLMTELDRLQLRDKTLVIFTGDNGTARFGVEMATVNGKHISGQKGNMLEGGSRVPLAVNWPGVTPAGQVNHDLIDFSDFFATFGELASASLPQGVTLDSHSFAAQIKGEKGKPRDWIYVELNGKSYVRNARYKLTNKGELFDLSEAPFKEIAVASNPAEADAAALSARKGLQAVLDEHQAAPAGAAAGKKAAKKAKRAAKKAAQNP